MPKHIYITTTLPYVNSSPHVGHALEFVQADALARFYRLSGSEVFFNTGTDEHGQKIAEAASKAGMDEKSYTDKYAQEFKNLIQTLNLSSDNFIRTTDPQHIKAAQHLWKVVQEKGDIYKKSYKGLYCVGCEAFLKESDLVDGACPNHPGKMLQEVEEENYFFALSKYKPQLKKYLQNPTSVIPEHQREYALSILDELEDISISRSKKRLSWGIPVPGDETQVMYVWFDALTNYISTLGYPDDVEGKFEKFWQKGKTIQLAGKDQVKFQSIIWQAMLAAGGIKFTDSVFYHGFITSGGQKMSKSLGNVISPYEMVDRYGTDATRYIFLRHVHPTQDSDITWEKMNEWYTANLVNGLGNLVARITKMAESYLEKPVQIPQKLEFEPGFVKALEEFRFSDALDLLWDRLSRLDQEITETQPFKLIKTEPEKAKEIVSKLAVELYKIAFSLQPIMPESAQTIMQAIKQNKKPQHLFAKLENQT